LKQVESFLQFKKVNPQGNPPAADKPHCGEYREGQQKTKSTGLVRQGGLDENFLKWSFWQLKSAAAPGVDRVDFYECRELMVLR
jgi:hypothetical protein